MPDNHSPFLRLRNGFLTPAVVRSDRFNNACSKERLYPEWEGELFMEAFERLVFADPHRMSMTFLDSKSEVQKSFTRGEIWAHSGYVAEKMVTKYGIKAGDRVMIVYPPGIDFVVALVACLRLGIVLVSVYPPNPKKLDVDIPKFAHFVSDSGSRVALTTKAFKRLVNISNRTKQWPKCLQWVSTDEYKPIGEIKQQSTVAGIDQKRHSSDLAIIQYTSGSTGKPKGIMISHGNIGHQCQYIIPSLRKVYPEKPINEIRYVGWVPQYHDLGFFIGILVALQTGYQSYIMSPITFLKNPTLWPIAMEKYKADFTVGPNFAFCLACKRTRDKGMTVNLQHMKAFGQGGEPAQIESKQLMEEVWNIRPNAFYNFYGLAESSACVAAMGQTIDSGRISAGDLDPTGLAGADVRVVTPTETGDFREAEEGEEGEIWSHSPSVALGYYGKPEATAQVFQAVLPDVPGKHFMRSGDVGYIKDNNLYVTSRLKDLIIINGKNYSPNDIEICVERAFPVVRPGSSVAFQHVNIASGVSEPDAVLVCEIRDERVHEQVLERLARDIRVRVIADIGVPIHEVVLVKARSVPKTTSGKVQRKECAKRWGCGQLIRLQPETQTKGADTQREWDMLGATSFEHLLKIARVENWDCTLSENGVDSLALTQLIHAAEKLGIILPYEQAITCSCKELLEKYSVLDNNTQKSKVVRLPEIKIGRQIPMTSCSIFIRQCVVILCLFLVISASAIPSAVLTNELYGRWAEWLWDIQGRFGPMATAAVLLWMLTYTVLCIVMKWILLGKQKPGDKMLLWSFGYIRWMIVQRLFGVWEHMVGRFLVETPYINLVYWMLGADVHRTSKIKSPFREWDLVKIGRDSTIKGILYPHFHTKHGVVFNNIIIGKNCSLGSKSVCHAPVMMEDNSIVRPCSYLSPSTNLTCGTWVGNPIELRTTETANDNGNDTDCDEEYDPWTITLLLTPVICASISVGAVVGFNFLLPAVSNSASASTWTSGSSWYVVSILLVYELVGLSFLALSVMLKWSFLSPYLTDKLSVLAFDAFFPYLQKTWVINYWHRLFGMNIGSSTIIITTTLCKASYAHRVKIGAGCLVANGNIVPSLGPTVWTWLSGKSSMPWSGLGSKRNVVLGDYVQCLIQTRVEEGAYVQHNGTVAAFTRVPPNTIVGSGTTAVGNPMVFFTSTVPNIADRVRKDRTAIQTPPPLILATTTEHINKVSESFVGMPRSLSSSCTNKKNDDRPNRPLRHDLSTTTLHVVLFMLWMLTVGGGAFVGVEVLRTLPIYGMHYIPRIMISIIYGIVFLYLYAWGVVFIFKWTFVGRSTARKLKMGSASVTIFYFIQSVQTLFTYIYEPFSSGLFLVNMFYYSTGVNVSILRSTLFSTYIEAAEADLVKICNGAVLDMGSYSSAHLAARNSVTLDSAMILNDAVLHAGAGFFIGSLGRDSQLLPLSMPLREVHIGDNEVWAGAPATRALVYPIIGSEKEQVNI
eukprot:CFRG2310T1